MTVSSEVSKSGPYTGNGVTVAFSYGFKLLDETHLKVIRTEAGVETVITTGFTVSGIGSPSGGTVTFSAAPTSLQQITLLRDLPNVQEIDLVNQGAFFADVVEQAFDLSAMRDQQLQEQLDRSVKLPASENSSALETLVADIIRLADSADAVDTVAGIEANVVAVAAIDTDVTTVAQNLADVTNFSDVYQGPKAVAPTLRNNGAALVEGDLYFDTVLDLMRVYTGSVWIASNSSVNGTLNRQLYIATGGQTTFSMTYDVGFVDVWQNGSKLTIGTGFTASNGTTIVLASGATGGDRIDIIAFGAFALADMLQKSLNGSDIPDSLTFLTNLGFSTFMRGLRATVDAAAFRTAIGARSTAALVVADLAAAAVRLSGEGTASPLDTELATALWAKTYTDAAITALPSDAQIQFAGTMTTTLTGLANYEAVEINWGHGPGGTNGSYPAIVEASIDNGATWTLASAAISTTSTSGGVQGPSAIGKLYYDFASGNIRGMVATGALSINIAGSSLAVNAVRVRLTAGGSGAAHIVAIPHAVT